MNCTANLASEIILEGLAPWNRDLSPATYIVQAVAIPLAVGVTHSPDIMVSPKGDEEDEEDWDDDEDDWDDEDEDWDDDEDDEDDEDEDWEDEDDEDEDWEDEEDDEDDEDE